MKKELYSRRSGAYKTSTDYARLKELLDAGHYVICFIHYAIQGTEYDFHDICLAHKNEYFYEFGARGIGYLSFSIEWENHFESLCESSGVEFIEPTNVLK